MTNYMLYRLTKRSNYMMADMLRVHVGFTPERSLLAGKELDEVLEPYPRPVEKCKVHQLYENILLGNTSTHISALK